MNRQLRRDRLAGPSLKQPVLLPLFFSLILLLGVLAISTLWMHTVQKGHLLQELAKSIDSQLQSELQEQANALKAQIFSLAKIESLSKAFTARDRQQLLQEAIPLYDELVKNNSITHFYFHGIDRINFLRVHAPKRYGDFIDRQTLKQAKLSAGFAHGVELGPLGTLTLRAVFPWKVGEEVIGYLELGKEISHITDTIQGNLGVKLYTLINKQLIEESSWCQGMEAMGLQQEWYRFPDLVLMAHLDTPVSSKLGDYLLSGKWQRDNFLETFFDGWDSGSEYLNFMSFTIKDSSGRAVGHLVATHDHTPFNQMMWQHILTMMVASMSLAALLAILFYAILDRVENKIANDTLALRKSEESLNLAQAITHSGSWERDLLTGQLLWSAEMFRICGVDPQTFVATYANYIKLLHPEDRDAVRAEAEKCQNQPERVYQTEYRLLRPDGLERVVHAYGKVVCDDNGKPIRMVGTVQDISDKRQSEALLKIATSTFSSAISEAEGFMKIATRVFEKAVEEVVVADGDLIIQSVNPAFLQITGYQREEIIGQHAGCEYC